MFGRDRRHRLEAAVAGVRPALAVLERVGGTPRGMVAMSVLADLDRRKGSTDLRGLTFFFTHRGEKDAVCRFDNRALSLVCSSPYASPPKPQGWEPLDLAAVEVDVAEALMAADKVVGADTTRRGGPELLVDALLRSVDGRPVWEVSYDVWLDTGPDTYGLLRVDATTGEVTVVRRDGA